MMTNKRCQTGYYRQCGITLVEMVVTIVILGIALTGITMAINQGLSRSADTLPQTRGVALAQSYLDEILGKRFDERSSPRGIPPCRNNCTAEAGFGPDGGETDRSGFDDVDDYHDLDEGWQQPDPLRDADGNERGEYGNFRVQVSVRYLDPGAGEEEENLGATPDDLDDEQDAKLVTVTVSHPSEPDGWDFSAYKSNF